MYARRGIYLLVRNCYFFMLLRYYIIYCLLHIVFLTVISRLGGWYFALQEPFTSTIFAYRVVNSDIWKFQIFPIYLILDRKNNITTS